MATIDKLTIVKGTKERIQAETALDPNGLYLADPQFTGNKFLGTDGNGDILEKELPILQGATSSVVGIAGIVPAPAAGDNGKYLRGDGTWADSQGYPPDNTTIKINSEGKLEGQFIAEITDRSTGLVVDFTEMGDIPDTTVKQYEYVKGGALVKTNMPTLNSTGLCVEGKGILSSILVGGSEATFHFYEGDTGRVTYRIYYSSGTTLTATIIIDDYEVSNSASCSGTLNISYICSCREIRVFSGDTEILKVTNPQEIPSINLNGILVSLGSNKSSDIVLSDTTKNIRYPLYPAAKGLSTGLYKPWDGTVFKLTSGKEVGPEVIKTTKKVLKGITFPNSSSTSFCMVPIPTSTASDQNKFLRNDGTWVTPTLNGMSIPEIEIIELN